MIYFDNAATSKNKPDVSYEAYMYYAQEIGTSPGRGSYKLGVQASRLLYQSRKTVNRFFGNPSKTNVVFTQEFNRGDQLILKRLLKER